MLNWVFSQYTVFWHLIIEWEITAYYGIYTQLHWNVDIATILPTFLRGNVDKILWIGYFSSYTLISTL